MSQELITRTAQQADQSLTLGGGRALAASVNAGAVSIEQERAIAEAQGQLILAKKFPRDLTAAHAELMNACKSPAFAAQAFYTVPNRGHGPSIRFAEEVARVYGNFQYGHRELSRDEGKSEVEVFAWDMQNNNRSIRQITVHHVRYSRSSGNTPLKDPSDIDNMIANVASKQIRGRILALMPKWLVAEAIDECKKTINGDNSEPLETRVRKMTQVFAKYGVTIKHLEGYLGHSLDKVLLDEVVDLTGVFNAIKEGTPASEFFGATEAEASQAEPTGTGAALAASAKQAETATAPKQQQRKPATKPASKPQQNESKPVEEQAQPDPVATDASASEAPVTDGGQADAGAGDEPEPQVEQDTPAGDDQAGDPAATDDDVF